MKRALAGVREGVRPSVACIAILAAVCGSCARLEPRRIEANVQSQGADGVVRDLYEDPDRWELFLDHVSSGSPAWLNAALAVAPGTDAGATQMLAIAVFMALEPSPQEVLQVFQRSSQSPEPALSPLEVCGDWVYIDYPEDEARALIRARISKLREVGNPELAIVRDECVRLLMEALALKFPQPLE